MARLLTLVSISALFAYASSQLLSGNVSDKIQARQGGCGSGSNQSSMCRNAFLNSLQDFCLYAPPSPGPGSTIGSTERIEVAWCIKSGRGTRLIPDGTISGAHFIQTPDFVQITGIGDLTRLNIPAGDEGGELDPHGADGEGNPVGGLVFSSAFGGTQQIREWTNFMSDTEFCFRACKPGPRAAKLCQHIYDVMGCHWNMPGNYGGGFTSCRADSGEPMGVYGASTFFQGQPVTPPAHPAPASSGCASVNTIANGEAGPAPSPNTTPTPTPSTTRSPTTAASSTTTSPSVTSHGFAASVSSSGSQSSASQNGPSAQSSATIPSATVVVSTTTVPSPASTNTTSSAQGSFVGLNGSKWLLLAGFSHVGALVAFFL